ncbi:MAG: ParB/RepB/Spo0J family partition protein [Lachnospiraceae bacterium]|nr:ParB/RepB/Spo0J family partition protein [Lachnospiraceae bacterium]
MAKKGLGKGLDALIAPGGKKSENTAVSKPAEVQEASKSSMEGATMVKITMVEPNREQPRRKFDEDALQELADSIKQFGVLQPLVVQDRKDHYEIIAGERRWRASKLAGLKEVPVIIKDYTEQEIVVISLLENIQREDLNAIEEANAYKELADKFNLKQDEIAEKVSKSRSEITNSMRLLKLCPEVQQMIVDEMLSKGHARTLLAVDDPVKQYELAQRAFDEKLSVREVEKLVKSLDKPAKEKPVTDEKLQIIYADLSEKLKKALGTKVTISGKGNGTGSVSIEFYNNDDLDKIVDKLSN